MPLVYIPYYNIPAHKKGKQQFCFDLLNIVLHKAKQYVFHLIDLHSLQQFPEAYVTNIDQYAINLKHKYLDGTFLDLCVLVFKIFVK